MPAPAAASLAPSAPGPAAAPCPGSAVQRGMGKAQCACAPSGVGTQASLAVTGCCSKPGGGEQQECTYEVERNRLTSGNYLFQFD